MENELFYIILYHNFGYDCGGSYKVVVGEENANSAYNKIIEGGGWDSASLYKAKINDYGEIVYESETPIKRWADLL